MSVATSAPMDVLIRRNAMAVRNTKMIPAAVTIRSKSLPIASETAMRPVASASRIRVSTTASFRGHIEEISGVTYSILL